MVNLLKGKYFWVNDDFNYHGSITKEYIHGSAIIENIILDENMIQFTINSPNEPDDLFQVTLIREDIGTLYVDKTGKITAELFLNEKRHLVLGKWREDEINYTWWAKVDRL